MQPSTIEEEARDSVNTNFLFGQSLGLERHESLLDKGVIDSTGVLELIAFLEERYSMKIENEEVIPGNLGSIFSISKFTARKLECPF